MRINWWLALLLIGCGDESMIDGGGAGDASAFVDGALADDGEASVLGVDGATIDQATEDLTIGGEDDGVYLPPGPTDEPLSHAAPTSITVRRLIGAGRVLDVGVDRGGGVWAVSASEVYYWPSEGGAPFVYRASDGLARANPSYPFAAVAGVEAGQAIVGNRGAIADQLIVDPKSGAVLGIDNMVVPFSTSPEYPEHLTRVTTGLRVAVDVAGTFGGTAYIGGIHGFTAWHGLEGGCNCVRFQEHQHFIPPDSMGNCDSTQPRGHCWGGDVKGLAITPEGDVWEGDEHFVSLLPQRSLGLFADFFQPFTIGIDVFPLVDDEISALAADASGGVWAASFGHGLAYLAPLSHLPSYDDRSRNLPQNRLTAVAVDRDGSLWIGTFEGGIARRTDNTWRYYTKTSGLPADEITALVVDPYASPRRVVIGTIAGVATYAGL